ncbi:MAG: PAS domain S-box protein [FCB group bacterium]|jgi:PAS domain S-box-containing protein|nr:PAS domain S-box protein [FCB group bacterium]
MKLEAVPNPLKARIQERFRALDNIPAQIWSIYDVETYGSVNLQHAEFLGISKEHIEFQRIADVLSEETAGTCKVSNREAFESGRTVHSEEWVMDRTGEPRLLSIEKAPQFGPDGEPLGYLMCCGVDISERVNTEQRVDHERWRLDSILQGTHTGTWEWNIQTNVTVFNERWAAIIGYTLAELGPTSFKTWESLAHPEDLERAKRLLERHLAGELPFYDCECRMRHKDGGWVWVHDRGRVVTYSIDGRPLVMFGTHMDITARKEADEVRDYQGRLLRTMLSVSNSFIDIAPNAVDAGIQHAVGVIGALESVDRCYVFLFDESRLFTTNTHEWCADGIEPQKDNLQHLATEGMPWWMAQLEGREVINIERVSDMPEEAAVERGHLEEQSIQSLLVVPMHVGEHLIGFLGFDSVRRERFWPEASIALINMVSNILANALNRKRIDTILQESEENHRTFFETIGDIFLVGDLEGRILYANSAASKKLGYSAEELKGMHIIDLHVAWAREPAAKILAAMLEGKGNTCALPLATKEGVVIPVESRTWFGSWSGSPCLFGMSKDLSKEQEALHKFDSLFRMNPALMAVSSMPEGRFTDVNDAFLYNLGYSIDKVMGKTAEDLGLFDNPEDYARVKNLLSTYGRVRDVELSVRTRDGRIRQGLFAGEVIESHGHSHFLTVMLDITERKLAEAELKNTIEELRSAAEQIQSLSGIVPICAKCKKIRDDGGYWEQVEAYISKHTEAQFSHGICPDCAQTLYPDYYQRKQ